MIAGEARSKLNLSIRSLFVSSRLPCLLHYHSRFMMIRIDLHAMYRKCLKRSLVIFLCMFKIRIG